MKKGLLGSTALVGATTLMASAGGAAEAPTWKLTGNANFQFYWVDQDGHDLTYTTDTTSNGTTGTKIGIWMWDTDTVGPQDHGWYFGVDEAELQLNVSGTADNGLNYGFKIELNANTTDGSMADEVRLQLGGSWGTLQMGDEDGAEDVMNYGGETLMGATGGFDGDQDDYLIRSTVTGTKTREAGRFGVVVAGGSTFQVTDNVAAPSYPTIAGDTSDQTKISYFSPRFSGFQAGVSITPTPNSGDNFKADGDWENHYGIGANYDNSFGGLRVRASAVYSAASSNDTKVEDISAWSVGGIVGWGPFSLGANYTDNGESGRVKAWNGTARVSSGFESSYWDVAAAFETGPFYFSAGYFVGTFDLDRFAESTYEHIALTADYTVAPGLGVYAEINMISDELIDGSLPWDPGSIQADGLLTNDTTSLVIGANVSF